MTGLTSPFIMRSLADLCGACFLACALVMENHTPFRNRGDTISIYVLLARHWPHQFTSYSQAYRSLLTSCSQKLPILSQTSHTETMQKRVPSLCLTSPCRRMLDVE